jgi:hypothetical protein
MLILLYTPGVLVVAVTATAAATILHTHIYHQLLLPTKDVFH